jgi:hypothetical protein
MRAVLRIWKKCADNWKQKAARLILMAHRLSQGILYRNFTAWLKCSRDHRLHYVLDGNKMNRVLPKIFCFLLDTHVL